MKPLYPNPTPAAIFILASGDILFVGTANIDDDGTGLAHGDKYHQSQTSLRHDGASLNADVDAYIVVPPCIVRGVPGIVLGSAALVMYGACVRQAVVGDMGPQDKAGEISVKLANDLGINSNPNDGGIQTQDIVYMIYVGTAAEGYNLQRS